MKPKSIHFICMKFHFQIKNVMNYLCCNGSSVNIHIHVHQQNFVQKCVRYGGEYILQKFLTLI